MAEPREEQLGQVHRLVVKIGTRLIAAGQEPIDYDFLDHLSRQLARLREREVQVVLVVSGAVHLGRRTLGLRGPLKEVGLRQAAAAVGQPQLISLYREALAAHGLVAAQILLTAEDMADRPRYLRVRDTVEALLQQQVVPVINENDSVSVEGVTFGENDRLAAIVAAKLQADLLVFLSDQPGLRTADPRLDPKAEIINVVHPGEDVSRFGAGTGGGESRGGMRKKLEAAQTAADCGIAVIIADGQEPNLLPRVLFEGLPLGTLFVPREPISGRKLWIATARQPAGRLIVDEGAARALRDPDGASLLPVGVVQVEGDFSPGDLVEVLDPARRVIARGIVNYSSAEVERIKRLHSREARRLLGRPGAAEVIHRDNLVVTAAG